MAAALLQGSAAGARGRGEERTHLPHLAARSADAPGLLVADQALRDQIRDRSGGAVPACAAARVSDASSEPRRGSAGRAVAAGSRGHYDDDDLHARCARALEAIARAAPPTRIANDDRRWRRMPAPPS